MSSIRLTRRGRQVRALLILGVILVAAIVAMIAFGHVPAMAPEHITDTMWQMGVDSARAR